MVFIYADSPLEERREMLNKQSVKKEERSYLRSLQPSEVDAERRAYSQDAIELQDDEARLKNIVADYKGKIESKKSIMQERLEKIKTSKTQITGILYCIPDHTEKRMMMYDGYGELIDSRDLLPQEMQGNIFSQQPAKKTDLPLPGHENKTTTPDKKKGNKLDKNAHIETLNIIKGDSVADPYADHNEDAWSDMSDDELIAVYGTCNIADIRTMKYNEQLGKWQTPDDFEKSKGVTPTALQTTVPNDADSENERIAAMNENAKKNKKGAKK